MRAPGIVGALAMVEALRICAGDRGPWKTAIAVAVAGVGTAVLGYFSSIPPSMQARMAGLTGGMVAVLLLYPQLFVEDRLVGNIAVLLASPLRVRELWLGKSLVLATAASLGVVVSYASFSAVSAAPLGLAPLIGSLALALGLALAIAAVALSSREPRAVSAATLLVWILTRRLAAWFGVVGLLGDVLVGTLFAVFAFALACRLSAERVLERPR